MLTFVKDYKNDDTLRRSFNDLAINTFGISFENWYQSGCWDDHYIPYSFQDDGKIVANASANRMTLVIDGALVSAIQIGTVMTDPAYRRKGLAYALIQKIFEDFDGEAAFYYLAANREAMPLYEKCGFAEVAETLYHCKLPIDIKDIGLQTSHENDALTLKKMSMSLEDFLKWKRDASPKGCQLDVMSDAYLAAFYWFHGFKDMLYALGDECLVVAEINEDGRSITLYDFYSKRSCSIHDVIAATQQNTEWAIEQVDFAFDVTGMPLPLESHTEVKSGWMIRSLDNRRFPETFCYPKMSQA